MPCRLTLPARFREQLSQEEKDSVRGVVLQLLRHLLAQVRTQREFSARSSLLTVISAFLPP
jgi:DNA-binding transcriptional regulator/RsmH inhibitor MraZ